MLKLLNHDSHCRRRRVQHAYPQCEHATDDRRVWDLVCPMGEQYGRAHRTLQKPFFSYLWRLSGYRKQNRALLLQRGFQRRWCCRDWSQLGAMNLTLYKRKVPLALRPKWTAMSTGYEYKVFKISHPIRHKNTHIKTFTHAHTNADRRTHTHPHVYTHIDKKRFLCVYTHKCIGVWFINLLRDHLQFQSISRLQSVDLWATPSPLKVFVSGRKIMMDQDLYIYMWILIL